MEFILPLFRKPVPLEKENLSGKKVKIPKDFSFAKNLVVSPLGFEEILPASMYYPVYFAFKKEVIFPFAVLGINERNFFVKEDGTWKAPVIPSLVKIYPFAFMNDGEEFVLLIDEEAVNEEDGEILFDEFSEETPFFKEKLEEIKKVILDFDKALKFTEEVKELGLFKSINLTITTNQGNINFKNLIIFDADKLPTLQPEKLWLLNQKGYLLTLLSHYLSLRNFKLLEIWEKL